MKIYKAEQDIQDKILSNTSLSFLMQPEVASKEEIAEMSIDGDIVAQAGVNDSDLYYHKAILVTTNWNSNDDVFVPAEVWPARHTPVHKPTNLNHESSKVVGHMTQTWAIDEEGNILDDTMSVADLPKKFHILTGAVIYKKYHNDADYEERVASLIEGIEKGEQYVSMECVLKDFDYALRAEGSDEIQVIDRNDETAFLTKHLRIYGGTGKYEGYKVGRVNKNISFIGKAYTPTPANKESIIFTNSDGVDVSKASFFENFDHIQKTSVLSGSESSLTSDAELFSDASIGDNLMSDVNESKVKDLTTKNESLAAEIADLKDQLAKVDVAKLEGALAEVTSERDELKTKFDEATTLSTTQADELTQLKADHEELTKAKTELDNKLAEIEQEKLTLARITYLVDGKFDKDEATEKVEAFAGLNDEQFKVMADVLIEAKAAVAAAQVTETVEEKTEESTPEDTVEAADLDNTETEENVTTASETTEVEDESDVLIKSIASKLKDKLNSTTGDK